MEKTEEQSASINELEAAVLAKRYEEAEKHLANLVELYSKSKVALTLAPFDRELSQDQKDLESFQVIEKIAFLLTSWFSDPNWQPRPIFFTYISMQKNFLNCLFAASSYHSTDHIVKQLGLLSKSNYTPDELKRILFVVTLESDIELPWLLLLEHIPDETAQTLSGLICSIGVQLTQRAQNNINRMLDAFEHLPTLETSRIQNFAPALTAYFNCSSLANSKKYELKKWVTRSVNHYLDQHLSSKIKKRLKKEVKSKPFLKDQKVMFIHEVYKTNHAMHRCWHYMFKSIAQNYQTVALGKKLDELAQEEFDTYYEIKKEWELEKIIELVLKEKPDVIIYPSVGMSVYAPFLAQLRLAPIQIACGGHPSSSYSKSIDYFTWEDRIDKQYIDNIIVEKYLPYPAKYTPVKLLGYTIQPDESGSRGETSIAINGVIQKVSNELIQLCQELTKETGKKLKFHFFMASPKQDLEFFAVKSILRRLLPNSEIHPFTSYSNYMTVLNSCKFAIATFPFGGSNSNIDLIRLGKPKLFTLNTADLPGFADHQLWESVGVLDGFCDSTAHLKQTALEWIENDDLVNSVSDKIKQESVQSILTENSSPLKGDDRLCKKIAELM